MIEERWDIPLTWSWSSIGEMAEVVGSAEARRGRVVRRYLVAPGAAEGVLGQRQELDVRESHAGGVLGQLKAWAEQHMPEVDGARADYDARQ